MIAMIILGFLAFGFVCYALGLWNGRAGALRELRSRGETIDLTRRAA